MQMKYVLTAMFYPGECTLQLNGYGGGLHDLQCRHGITSISYHENPISSKVIRSAWRFYHDGNVGDCPNNFLFKQASGSWKQVMFDLQSTCVVDWVNWWPEQTTRVPTDWFMDISLDGETYIRALTMSQFNGGSQPGYVVNAARTMENRQITLLPIKARFLRICFDEASRVNKEDEWAVEVRLALEDKQRAAPDLRSVPDTTFYCAQRVSNRRLMKKTVKRATARDGRSAHPRAPVPQAKRAISRPNRQGSANK